MRRALRGEAVPGFEVDRTILSKPEPERTVLISYHPARDEADEVVGVSVSVVDITELKRNERARLASEEHYRTAMDLNPQVPWTADPEGMILDAGPRWEELTGLPMEETLN
jgi:PAS domain-containing protein